MRPSLPLWCCLALAFTLIPLRVSHGQADESNRYLGSKACADCHAEQYESFSKYAKKARSDRSVQRMAHKLKPAELQECYDCHTTGHGRPGGFVSYEATPELGHCGCEVCHGPGQRHVDAGGDPALIKGALSLKDCEACHNPARVQDFDFRPLLFGGAH